MTAGKTTGHAVSLSKALASDRGLLENLAQFYAYDFSEVLPMHVAADGRFAEVDLGAWWVDSWRHPFLVRVGESIAGFALIATRSKITGESGTTDMTEFFVMRRFRRSGVGRAAAVLAFDLFPGRWEVRQRTENPGATAFWRRAIEAYAKDGYSESTWVRPDWSEVVQTFSNSSKRA